MGLSGQRPGRATVHLRTLAVVGASLLTLFTLTACVTLAAVTTFVRQAHRQAALARDGIRATEGLPVALLRLEHDSNHAFLTKNHDDERSRLGQEGVLMAGLADARAAAIRAQQQSAFDDVERRVGDYLVARRAAEATAGSLVEVIHASSAPLFSALGSLEQLIQDERDAGRHAWVRAEIWDRVGNVIGIAVGAGALIGFLVVLLRMHHFLTRPLLGLGDAIRRIARGDAQARAPERGAAELVDIAHALNAMADRLARLDADRLRFLGGVAHDLRNPLAVLRAATHLLQPDGGPRLSDDDQREAITVIGRQVTRLERMVGDVLDAARIESGHLELRMNRQDLRVLAKETVYLHQVSSIKHEIDLEVPDEPVMVRCDSTRIEQVLNNLLSNAIKYSPRGGVVTVTVGLDGGQAAVSVTDRGIGIAADELEQVFEPFRRTGASRETIPGVGLGLSVSRRIIEDHGGSIEVTSQPGYGSTFRVLLPIEDERAAAVKAPSPA